MKGMQDKETRFWKSKGCGPFSPEGDLEVESPELAPELFWKSQACGLAPQGYSPWTSPTHQG